MMQTGLPWPYPQMGFPPLGLEGVQENWQTRLDVMFVAAPDKYSEQVRDKRSQENEKQDHKGQPLQVWQLSWKQKGQKAFIEEHVQIRDEEMDDFSHFITTTREKEDAIKLQKRKVREVEVEVVKEVEVIKTIQVPGPERIVDREVKVREEVYVPVPATPAQLEALMKAESLSLAEGVAA